MEELNIQYDAKFFGGLVPIVSRKAVDEVAEDSNQNAGGGEVRNKTRTDTGTRDRTDTVNSMKRWLDEK